MALPCIFTALYKGCFVESIMVIYVVFEILCSFIRIVFLKININLSVTNYLKRVIIPLVLPILLTVEICFIYSQYSNGISCITCFIISAAVLSLASIRFGLAEDELKALKTIINRKKRKV
jgi:hypothetical protein